MADKIGRVFIEVDADIQKMNAKFADAINKIQDADGKLLAVGNRMAKTVENALNPTQRLGNQIAAMGKAGVSAADTWRYLGERIERAMDIAKANGKAIDPLVQQLYEQAKAAGLATTATQRWGAQWTNLSRLLSAAGIGIGIYQITRGLVNLTKESVQMAVSAVESENLFSVSMGKMAGAAREWSQALGKSLGLNEYELRKNIATFNVMFTAMGMGANKAFEMAKGLTQLAYDFSSFYNLRPDEAFEKLRSGISGEIEPLRRLGIVVDEASTKTYAYSTGIAKFGEDLTQQQKVLARYGLILQQTSAAQGDLARTIDSPANAMRVLASRVDMLQTSLGFAFLPTLIAVTGELNNFVSAIRVSDSGLQYLAKVIAAPIMGFLVLMRTMADTRLAFAELRMAVAITDKAHRDAGQAMQSAAAASLEYNDKIAKLEKNVESLGKFEYGAAKAAQAMEMADINASKEAEKRRKEMEKAAISAAEMQIIVNDEIRLYGMLLESAAKVWTEKFLPGIKQALAAQMELEAAGYRYMQSLDALFNLKPREPWLKEPINEAKTLDDFLKTSINQTIPQYTDAHKKSGESIADVWKRQVSTIVTDWSRGIADILVEGADFGKKLTDIFKETGKGILRSLIETLFNPLKDLLNRLLNQLLGWVQNIFKGVSGAAASGLGGFALGGWQGLGLAGAGAGGMLAYTGWNTPGAKGWAQTIGGAAATGAGIGTMILPGVGTVVGAFLGMYVGAFAKAIQQWTGKESNEAGAIEAGRDFGINLSKKVFSGFYESIGLTESPAYGIRKELLSSPKFMTEVGFPLAIQQGQTEAYLKSLERITTAWGTFNLRNPFEEWLKTGSAEKLNEAYKEAFGPSRHQEFQRLMAQFDSTLAATSLAADEAADATTGLSEGMQGLLESIVSAMPAVDDMYGVFFKTGEILPELAAEIQKYGGSLEAFQRYASLGGLRENLTAIGNLISGLGDILPELDPIQKLLSGGGIDWTGLQAMGLDPSKLISMADLVTFESRWEDSIRQFQDTGRLLSGSVLQQALWKFGGVAGATALSRWDQGFNTITPGLLDATKAAMDVAYQTERATALDYLKGIQSTMESEIQAASDAIVTELRNILAAIQGDASQEPAQAVTAQGGTYIDMRGATVYGYEDFESRVQTAWTTAHRRGAFSYAVP